MRKINRKKIIEAVLPWTVLAPIALALGIILRSILHRLVYGTPVERAASMIMVTIVVLVVSISLKWLGEKLSRRSS